MRVIIRTVSLITLLSLQSVDLGAKTDKSCEDIAASVCRYVATAQKQAEAEVEEALAEAKNEMARAQKEMATAQEEMEAIEWEFDGAEDKWRAHSAAPAPSLPSVKLDKAISIITDKVGPERAENVLVIPAGDMDAQRLAETVEDMKIMSHIFAKELAEADMLPGGRSWVFFWRRNNAEPRGIYLEGYGALFLMDVDFPLLPVPEPDSRKAEEGTDPVWDQARRQLTDSEGDIFDPDSDEEVEYDADKVTELKSKLIRILKHASNIRNLPDDEWIVIAVTGSGRDSADIHISTAPEYLGRFGRGTRARSARTGGRVGGSGRSGSLGSRSARGGRGRVSVRAGDAEIEVSSARGIDRDAPTPLTSGNVLIMRARKADVDTFAKGKLDFEKFQKRVQMFTY